MGKTKMTTMVLVAALISSLFLAACAASTTTKPAISPAAAPTATAAPLPAVETSAQSPEEAAWQKIVEAARKEGVLTIYSFHFASDIGSRIARDFKNRYGIRLEIMPGSSRISVEKIKVEQSMNRPIADILQSSTPSATELTLSKLSTSVYKELPALKDKSPFAFAPVFSPGGEILYFSRSYSGDAINTNLVKPQDEPRSYYDILTPKWKGKILSPEPRLAQAGIVYYSMRYFKALDMDYFRRLAQQDMKLWQGDAKEAYREVARGEYSIYIGGDSDSATPVIKEGAPLKLLAMEEGTIVWGAVIQIVKNAPHPNAARLFLNWILTPEGQLAYTESAGAVPLRQDVPYVVPPGARVTPKKAFARNWDSETQTAEDIKAGVMEQIFGKR